VCLTTGECGYNDQFQHLGLFVPLTHPYELSCPFQLLKELFESEKKPLPS
jgi:hypothetical protein